MFYSGAVRKWEVVSMLASRSVLLFCLRLVHSFVNNLDETEQPNKPFQNKRGPIFLGVAKVQFLPYSYIFLILGYFFFVLILSLNTNTPTLLTLQ